MSLLKTNAAQIGQSVTATNNFTIYQPSSPDGTVRWGVGNSGSVTDIVTLNSSGNVGIGTSSPQAKLSVSASGAQGIEFLTSSATSIGIQSYNRNTSAYIDQAYVGSVFTWTTGGVGERMRVTNAGYVGIATSSPADTLHVMGGTKIGSSSSAYTFQIYGNANWNYAQQNIYRNASNTGTPRFLSFMLDGDSESSTTIGGYNAIWGSYDSSPTTGSTSSGLNGKMVYGAYAGHQWYTNGTEQARINANDFLIGATTNFGNGGRVCIDGTTNGYTGNGLNVKCTSGAFVLVCYNNGGGGLVYFTQTGGGSVGTITTNGSSTSYNTTSDYRQKENVQPMQNALATVAQLNPVTYTWKNTEIKSQGFIAHELQAVVPDCVTGEKDAVDENGNPIYQGIDTSFLVATLTKAIQELTARIEQLEAK